MTNKITKSSNSLKKSNSEFFTIDADILHELKKKYELAHDSNIRYRMENDIYKNLLSNNNKAEIMKFKLIIDHYKNLLLIVNIVYILIILILFCIL
jgi:hypothetical protein